MQAAFRSVLLLGLLSLGACSTPLPQPPASLLNTSWTLVAYRPAVGPELRPSRPDQYRLQFQADGKLAAQIDCNRGSGSWETTGQSGLQLGPLALTRMMCPPDALQGKLPAALESVQSYRVVDGQLLIDAGGNGGSYVWKMVQP